MGAARKLDKDQEDFEAKQLSSLEAIAESEPGEVLAKAVEINLIDEDTKEAIKKAMPGHETIFQRALEKAGAGPAAFKKAFRSVYGRFLMERGGAKYKLKVAKDGGGIEENEINLEDKDGPLMKRLGKVLKFSIEDGVGMKGRTELAAALNRLRLLGLETDLGNGELENVAILEAEKKAETSLQEKVNFLESENSKLANIKTLSDEIYAIDPVGPDAEKIDDRFTNEVEPLVNSLDSLSAGKIPDSLNATNLTTIYEKCIRGIAAVKKNDKPGSLKMALMILMDDLKTLNSEMNSETAKANTELAAKKADIIKIEGSAKGTLVAKIIGKIDKEIAQIDKDLAKPDVEAKKKKELEDKKKELQKQRLNPVEWIIDKSFPQTESGAKMERLKRKHHDAEHEEHELKDVYKFFSGHDSFTKVVEISEQLDGAINDWRNDRDKNVQTIGTKLDDLDKEIAGLGDSTESEKEILNKKKNDRESLAKKKNKSGLEINGRVSYLKEQIALKEKSTLSDAEIEKLLNERGKGKDPLKWEPERKKERERMEKENENKAEERGEMKEELERLNLIIAKSKEFRTELAKLIDNAAKAEHLGIDLKKHVGEKKDAKHAEAAHHDAAHEHHDKKDHKEGHDDNHDHGIAAGMVTRLQGINLDNRDFSPDSLIGLYKEFNGLFGDSHKVQALLEEFDAASANKAEATKERKKELDKATASAEKGKNLTDADAAKKIIGTMVGLEFPDISPMDHNKLVTMILAEDVATLQTDEGYEALAQRATAEKSEAATFAGFRTKLLNFKYKEGDKVNQPFKGLKPEDFESWEKMDKLFTFGKLNYEKGTFVLAAFEDFDNGIKSIQSVKLEKKLKTLLAKKLGVDAHMDKAGISKVVDDAFKAQMEKVRPIMKAHAEMAVGEKGKKARENKKHVLDMKYQELNDQFRSGKFSSEIYDHKLEALIKEAKEADVNVEFSADTTGAKYWNSPYAQWLKDKLHDAGSFVGKKALAAGVFAPLKIAGKGVWGATKLGTALGFQTALLPVRAAKYPLLLAAKPLVGFINLFRANKWTPLPGLRDSVKNDTARIMGYAKEKASGVAKGTAETVAGTVSGEWGKVKYADTKYADRNKKKADERAELMKIHEPKSDLEAIEVPDSPFVDLAKYKKQIDMVATALGIKIDAPHGAEVKVGHEEKKDDHSKPHDAAHGAHDAHGEKKEEHGHGHEEKKDAHAKPEDHSKPAHH